MKLIIVGSGASGVCEFLCHEIERAGIPDVDISEGSITFELEVSTSAIAPEVFLDVLNFYERDFTQSNELIINASKVHDECYDKNYDENTAIKQNNLANFTYDWRKNKRR